MGFRTEGIEQNSTIQQGAFLVYIAGVHVPASSVSVDFSVQTFPTATINMPADNTLLKLGEEDRVPVVIFYLDKWYSNKDPSKGVTPTWRLLFDGDITQWRYQRSPYSRIMSLTAISHNSVLNSMTILYLDGSSRELITTKSLGDTEAQRAGRMSAMQVISFFKKGAYGSGDIKTPIGFIKNLLLGMKIGGSPIAEVADPSNNKVAILDAALKDVSSSNVSSTNFIPIRQPSSFEPSASSEFFIKYNHRNKVDKRWIASTIEDVTVMVSGAQISEIGKEHESTVVAQTATQITTKKIQDEAFIANMKKIAFDSIKNGFTQKRSFLDSFWNLILQFYGNVLYNIIQIPTAQYVHVNESDVPSEDETSQERLGNCISVPNMSFALSPSCNVLTPAMVKSFSFQEDYASQNTRVIADGSYLSPAQGTSDEANEITKAAMRYGYPTDQNAVLEPEHTTKKSAENILIYPEEYFKGPVVSRPKAPAYFLTIEQASLYDKRAKQKINDENTTRATNAETKKENEGYDASTVSARQWRQELLYGFTKSYYLENKYSARQGSIELAFTPYVIPGMTFTMIDGDDFDQFHLTGLVTGVSINMSNAGLSTSLSYTAGRTLKEVYEQVFSENTFGPDLGITDRNPEDATSTEIYTTAPILPVRTLADQLQTDSLAQDYYKTLLYTKDDVGGNDKIRSYVFKHSEYFKSTSGAQLAADHPNLSSNIKGKLKGKAGKTFPGTITDIVTTPKTATTAEGIGKFNLELNVKDDEFSNINDYELSMRRSARPICSIEDYISMFNITSDKTIIAGLQETNEEFGIPYPIKIRLYVVNADELGDNFIRPAAKQGAFNEPASELRRDWPSKMLEYRKRVKENSILGR